MDSIPHGYCRCGCGRQTPPATRTRPERGMVEGQPAPFVSGHYMRQSAPDRLAAGLLRNPTTGCLEWQGAKDTSGYGMLRVHGRQWKTHRYAWVLANGPIPDDMQVLHHCDNPPCGDPTHLFIGTNLENMQDCARKGRRASGDESVLRKYPELAKRGTESHFCTTSEETARAIKRDIDAGIRTKADIARAHGVRYQVVYSIAKGYAWKHLP